MNLFSLSERPSSFFRAALWVLLFLSMPMARAATLWTGQLYTFTEGGTDPTQRSNQDHLTSDVWFTRTNSGGLFNAFSETIPDTNSPADTLWAMGTLDNYSNLNFQTWLAMLNGASPTNLVGKPLVVHILSSDIYLSLKFSFWGSHGSGGFSYQRSTPPPTLWTGPTITFTEPGTDPGNPSNQDRLTDNVWLTRAQTMGLFNAVFEPSFNKTTLLDPSDTEWSFGTIDQYSNLTYTTWTALTTNNPPALVGVPAVVHLISDNIYVSINFRAWGQSGAGGFSYTRSTVLPVLSSGGITNNQFSITSPANPGTSYILLSSPDLSNWTPVQTNLAVTNTILLKDNFVSNQNRFYRVGGVPSSQ